MAIPKKEFNIDKFFEAKLQHMKDGGFISEISDINLFKLIEAASEKKIVLDYKINNVTFSLGLNKHLITWTKRFEGTLTEIEYKDLYGEIHNK